MLGRLVPWSLLIESYLRGTDLQHTAEDSDASFASEIGGHRTQQISVTRQRA